MKNKTYLQQILMSMLLISTLASFQQCYFKKTAAGLQYKVVRQGKGPKPQDGEVMLFDMLYTTEKGKTIFNSADQAMPLALQYNDSTYQKDGGINEVISMLQKGDSTIFKMNAKALLSDKFEQLAEKYQLDDKKNLFLHIDVKDVMAQDAFKAWEQKQYNTMQEQWKEKITQQLNKELASIDSYLADNKITALTTDSGLRYVIDQPGQGPSPKPNNTVKVNYTGKTLAGKVFDTSVAAVAKQHELHNPLQTYEPLQFTLGAGQVIPGWEEGIMLLTKGTKARLFIPSYLAYGTRGAGKDIKANEILVFEVELVDIFQK